MFPARDPHKRISFSNKILQKIVCVLVFRCSVLFREFHLQRKSPRRDLKRETYREVVLGINQKCTGKGIGRQGIVPTHREVLTTKSPYVQCMYICMYI